ncbi:hypothetical protein N1030_14035 [Desulfovibrio mangrovi]|uniref:hypothetical protein n=1 Tax=Desulfovibrio mangrovi TaxID=2976983 RepID=UPI0022480E45|nr:hypothetical protein [Desulfovibrio mangrovi]UZP66720.1 hypothetical protein N1030_14035 [Desulfovibrio mangrovi]
MPPRNYKFEKRQKDLAKSKKKEEKLQKKLMKKHSGESSNEMDTENNAQEMNDMPGDALHADSRESDDTTDSRND